MHRVATRQHTAFERIAHPNCTTRFDKTLRVAASRCTYSAAVAETAGDVTLAAALTRALITAQVAERARRRALTPCNSDISLTPCNSDIAHSLPVTC